jgi:phosphatidylserine/phosphatidylglycerophosphate/cardiolipin synthase-like enzyme
VRVLLDADRPTDPYMSTIINTDAREYLEAAGIDCRLDATDRLLHSKFVVVDGAIVVLGSHNWSAGSYFHFDDMSLLVRSSELAAQLTTRFAALWPV